MLRNRQKKNAPFDEIKDIKQKSRGKKREKNNFDVKIIAILFIIICSLLYCCYYFFNAYQRYILIKPINLPEASISYGSNESSQLFWGSYRPNLYFGLKSRSEKSLLFGIMWYTHLSNGNIQPIRHWCEQNDKLIRYGWLYHDGRTFGEHEIIDYGYGIISSFIKKSDGNGGWSVKINVQSLPQTQFNETIGLIAYVFQEHEGSPYGLKLGPAGTASRYIGGSDPRSGAEYRFDFVVTEPRSESLGLDSKTIYGSYVKDGARVLTNHVYDNLIVLGGGESRPVVTLPEKGGVSASPDHLNFAAFHVVPTRLPLRLDITFRPDLTNPGPIDGSSLHDAELSVAKKAFDRKFENTFGTKNSGNFSREDWAIARSALSNLVGGIGFFYGHSLVAKAGANIEPEPGAAQGAAKKTKGKAGEVHPYFAAQLYTAVPSRSFFPRGFLWDEGFHQLIVAQWDPDISAQIVASWFDLMNANGWIPREQILGDEARAKVPAEFVVQKDDNANPPALFLALEVLWALYQKNPEPNRWSDLGYLNLDFWIKIFPRAVMWYDWFNRTQGGLVHGSYRWRGRDAAAVVRGELNPKTLTSGLDDYPRPTHPSAQERHVDLRCWMAMGARVLATISDHFRKLTLPDPDLKAKTESLLKSYDKNQRFASSASYLSDPKELVRLHWSEAHSMFADYGLHTPHVELRRVPIDPSQPARGTKMMRFESARPELQFAGRETFGYVSLFPFLARFLPRDSPQLARLLEVDLRDESLLWSPYGLRSLARSSAVYYRKPNTEHDPPYWRGNVWINVNYLALRALKYYGTPGAADGPEASATALRADQLYVELRRNLVANLVHQYKRTGYMWENYDDRDGRGQGAHPFAGWTSLLTLIMAEIY